MTKSGYKQVLRVVALSVAGLSLAAWLALGANRGWTKTNVTHMAKDPITDLEYPVIEKKFVPGVDFLASSWMFALILFGASLIRKQLKTNG